MSVDLVLRIKFDRKDGIYEASERLINCFYKPTFTSANVYDSHGKVLWKMISRKKGEEIQSLSANHIINLMKKYANWEKVVIGGTFFNHSQDNPGVSGYLTIRNKEYPEFSWVTLTSDGHKTLCYNPAAQRNLFLTLGRIVEVLDPAGVWVSDNEDIDGWFEYYRDPYMFCTENVTENKYLDEIKRVLPRDELIKLIEMYSDGVIKGKEGIGVIRIPGGRADPGSYGSSVYPRYFIRREIRRRGIKLKPGRTEEMIIEGLRIRPDLMFGFIDEALYKKINEIKENLEKEVRERILSTGRYDINLIEKYYEARRKSHEYWEKTKKHNEEYDKEFIKLSNLCSDYTHEFWKEYDLEVEKAVLRILPEDMLKGLGLENENLTNSKSMESDNK